MKKRIGYMYVDIEMGQACENRVHAIWEHIQLLLEQHGVNKGRVAIFGLASVENESEYANSDVFQLVQVLSENGLSYTVYDPYVNEFVVPYQCKGIEEAVRGADVIVAMTNHDHFYNLNVSPYPVRRKIVLDTNYCLNHKKWLDLAFDVHVLGDTKGKK